MTLDPLASSWHKYRWAQYHANAVNAALNWVFDTNKDILPLNIEVDQHGDEATATARIRRLPIIHERCGLHLGDAIQNYRAALDHLAWDLVRIGANPKPNRPQDVQFPTADSFKNFPAEIRRRLPGIAKDQKAVFRPYQPYSRGVHGTAIRRLQRLSNMDKHRVLIPAVVTPAGHTIMTASNWRYVGPPEYFITNRRALKVNAKVMQVELIRSDTGDCQVNVDGNLQVYPSLGRGLHIGEALTQIKETVFSILETFEKLI